LILAAFRVRSFRFQWSADLLASWAFEMETLVLGWYIMVHTGSVLLLTAFASLQYVGTLAAPIFGVLGDRLDARAMLRVMRASYAALAALLACLALADLLSPVWVLVIATLAGVVRPNDLVMRNTLIGETIPPEHLMGALGLSRTTMDSARIAGSLAGASLSTVLGMGYTYLFVTGFYLMSLALTFGVSRRPPVAHPAASSRPAFTPSPSGWQDLTEGLVRVLRTPELLAMMLLAFLVNLTAYPVSSGLLPYAAQRIYRVDATGLGWLVASFALGGLAASVLTVVTGRPWRPARATLVGAATWYVVLLGFGQAGSLGPALAILLLAGFAQNIAMIAMAATLLGAAGAGFRGRVMGVRMLAVYGLPVGLLVSGLLIEQVGYRLTITLAAASGLLATVVIGLRWRASIWEPGPAGGSPPGRSFHMV
jgi:predicted MFS family arabinose efflux permease